jgi:uncharacterized protein YidB (DUF937 family)
MSLFDRLQETVGGMFGAGADSSVLQNAVGQVFPNGLQDVLNQLQSTGFGSHVSSWLGNGPNQPITVDQLRAGLSDERVQQLGQKLGLPVDKVLALLSEHLPAAVDQQSPQGTLQQSAS